MPDPVPPTSFGYKGALERHPKLAGTGSTLRSEVVKRRKFRSCFQNAAGFYNFDALLLSLFLLIVSVTIVNIGSHWGMKWLEWMGATAFLFAIGLYLYLCFLRK